MDGLDAPMPPMGADDMGMGTDDPMMGGDPMGGDPTAMGGGEDPMGGDDPMGGGEPSADGGMDADPMGGDPTAMGGGDEFMDKYNQLSPKEKETAEKYVDSLLPQDGEQGAPMESYTSLKRLIDETINDVLDNKEGTKRPSKKLPNEYNGMTSPFKSPF